jgi:hypothetical protein
VIVGGGLSGLACSRELRAPSILIEAADRVGGLVRTETVQGFLFDWAGHWLHLRDPDIQRLVEERWLCGNLLRVERRARIYSEGRWTEFPYQHHLHGLPAETIRECLLGYVRATAGEEGRGLRERPLRNAAEFIDRHLGEGFARHFLTPYNEKLYGVPCTELSPEWGGRFIPRPSLDNGWSGRLGLPSPAGTTRRSCIPAKAESSRSPRRGKGGDLRDRVKTRLVALDLCGTGRAPVERRERSRTGALVYTALSLVDRCAGGGSCPLVAAAESSGS